MKKVEFAAGGLVEMEQVLKNAEVGRLGLTDGNTPTLSR